MKSLIYKSNGSISWRIRFSIFLICICSAISPVDAQMQIKIHDNALSLDDVETKRIVDSTIVLFKTLDLPIVPATILNTDDACHLVVSGFNYVFLWENNEFTNLYKGRFHGHNFGSYKFEREGIIYSYGGYGFWSFHNQLTYFDTMNSEWDVIPTEGKSSMIHESLQRNIFSYKESLFGYFPYEYEYSKGRSLQKVFGHDFFKLDLNNNTWVGLGRLQNTSLFPGPSFETDHYYFTYKNSYAQIIDKASLRYKSNIFIDSKVFPNFELNKNKHPLIYKVFGDSLSIYSVENFAKYTLDISSLYASSDSPTMSIYKTTRWPLLELFILIGMLILSYWYWRRKKDRVNNTAFPYPL